MKLIVGLGNPGVKYVKTRHNIGFMFVDYIINNVSTSSSWKSMFNSQYCKLNYLDQDFIFLKPETFMNLSGKAVIAFLSYFKIAKKDILIIHDELDFDLGVVRLKDSGGSAGHNGIKSIVSSIGTNNFLRMRIGISRPEDKRIPVDAWVLGKFSATDLDSIKEVFYDSKLIFDSLYTNGLKETQNKFNKGSI